MLTSFIACRYYAKPLIKIQKVQNLTVVFKFITEVEKISLGDISKWSRIHSQPYTMPPHPPPPQEFSFAILVPQDQFWCNLSKEIHRGIIGGEAWGAGGCGYV